MVERIAETTARPESDQRKKPFRKVFASEVQASGDHALFLSSTFTMDNTPGTQSPSQLPASSIKYHHPYFTPTEIEIMSEKQRGKMTVTQEDKIRQNACGFIDTIGSRIGL